MEQSLITSIGHFSLYFFGSLITLFIFKVIYCFITPYDEWKLIKEDKNTAAAIGLGGAILGFSLALSGAIKNSVSFIDFLTWAIIALLAQVLAFTLVRFFLLKKLVQRIEQGELSAAIILASINAAVGLLNAACMTY